MDFRFGVDLINIKSPAVGPDPWTADASWPEFVLLELLKDRWSHVCEALEHEVNALGERGSAWGVHWGLTGEVGVKLTDVVLEKAKA